MGTIFSKMDPKKIKNMKRIEYPIKGMSCAACVAHVERAVRRVLGEDARFTVSLLTNSVVLFLSEKESQSDLEIRLASAIKAAGYELITQGEKNAHTLQKNRKRDRTLTRWIVSVLFTLAVMYLSMGGMLGLPIPTFLTGAENALAMAIAQLVLTLPVVVIHFKFFRSGMTTLLHRAPNMDSLIAVGSGASLVYGIVAIVMIALAGNDTDAVHAWMHDLYFESAAMILTLVSLGKMLEARAKDRAADAVRSLAELSPKYATVLKNGVERSIPVEEITVGDILLIRAGEWIAVDGEVLSGSGSVDESALTGESMPVDKEFGSRVRAACILTAGALTVRADGVGEDTSLSRIIRLLEDAAASKAPIARVADRVSAIFVPCVMAISALTLLIWLLITGNAEQSLRSAIAVLVISCPCALGLATPTAITEGIGRGARNGILFRSAEALERLCAVRTVVFDKTGTLTEGRPTLTDLYAYGISPEELLSVAASVEHLSAHPIAGAIVEAAEQASIPLAKATNFEALTGIGAVASVGDLSCRVVKPSTLNLSLKDEIEDENPPKNATRYENSTVSADAYTREDSACASFDLAALDRAGKTAAAVEINGRLVGILGISDRIRPESAEAVRDLRAGGVRCLMLSGDRESCASHIATQAGLDGYRASLMPEDKEEIVRALSADGGVAMVGDGINDAPALVRADVGIAIGAGTDVAIDCAGVVLSQSTLTGVSRAYRLSRATMLVIKQNLFWALFYNAVCIPVAAGVFYPLFQWQLTPMIASAAMSLSSVCVVTNALRLRRVPILEKTDNHKKICAPACENRNTSCEKQPKTDLKGESDPMLFGKKKEQKNETAQTYVIAVEGMMCPRCVAHVKTAIEGVSGVSSVDVSLENASATVVATAPLCAITRAILDAGYEVK